MEEKQLGKWVSKVSEILLDSFPDPLRDSYISKKSHGP